MVSATQKFEPKPCDECGIIFTPTRKWQRFCTTRGDKCRKDNWKKQHSLEVLAKKIKELEKRMKKIEKEYRDAFPTKRDKVVEG